MYTQMLFLFERTCVS